MRTGPKTVAKSEGKPVVMRISGKRNKLMIFPLIIIVLNKRMFEF